MDEIILSREKLRRGKYTRGFADLTADQLEALLWLLGEWSIRGGGGHPRAEAALEALKDFRYEPLTLEDVYVLMQEAKGK